MSRSTKSVLTRPTLCLTQTVLRGIQESIGRMPAEQGGILGGSREDGIVRYYQFDRSARRTRVAYSPDTEFLNQLLTDEWNPQDIYLLGFVHSHPPSLKEPSEGDLAYARRILECNPELPRLLLPIVVTEPDSGRFAVFPFAAVRDRDRVVIEELDLELLEHDSIAPEVRSFPSHPPAERNGQPAPASCNSQPVVSFRSSDGADSLWETFRRVRHAYDLSRLAASRIIYIGTGGAASFAEELARAGVAEHILIDPDEVSESNLATQQVYRRDLGRPKVESLAERLRDIHPQAVVVTRQQKIDDIDDAEFERLATAPLRQWQGTAQMMWGIPGVQASVHLAMPPAVTLVCGLTDSFEAQARVNRLALQFGLPSLCAQVYREGRGAEITFTYPGVTPACHRCALSGRYQAYLQKGFKNDVTSDGTPIFATTRLNALKGFLALALLQHGSPHPRWGKLLDRIGSRNLIQIRMDPDLNVPAFARVFVGGDQERILFDDVVWLPQKPDCPANGFPSCPDCGGTGDLRNIRGTIADTRPMRS